MATKALPSQELLRKLLRYDPVTGRLYWLPRGPDTHPGGRTRKIFNTQFAGKEALCADVGTGYRIGAIHNTLYLAHRVIWMLVYGEEPLGFIDHINGNKADNRLGNLRVVTQRENALNQKRSAANTTGVTGVYPVGKKWTTKIYQFGKVIRAGRFETFGEAVEARKALESAHGYHPNHGRASPSRDLEPS